MAKAHFQCEDGISVAELLAILRDCPTKDDEGEEAIVYVLAGNGHLSALTEVIVDDEGSTIMLPEFHSETMQALGTYDEFFGYEPEILPDDEDGEGCELAPVGLN
jgi:hypothetical protein